MLQLLHLKSYSLFCFHKVHKTEFALPCLQTMFIERNTYLSLSLLCL